MALAKTSPNGSLVSERGRMSLFCIVKDVKRRGLERDGLEF